MRLEDIQRTCPLFVQNFKKDVSIYLFGSAARRDEMDIELDEVFGGDIDLLFLVPQQMFNRFYERCYAGGVDFASGKALDPWSYFWEYHSPKELRLEAAFLILGIDESLQEQVIKAFQNYTLDILILPFGWEEDYEILGMINSKDPEFSRNIMEDAKLLFSQEASLKIG